MAAVTPIDIRVAGLDVHLLSAPGTSPPTLYLHGVPSAGFEWREFLRRGGGVAPDLPGFGGSDKPADRSYTIAEYGAFVEQLADALELARLNLVVHDWGAVGLEFAQRCPERIARLVVIDAVPLLAGYRWHRAAKIWRTPLLGELSLATTTPAIARVMTREANVTPGPLPESWLREAMLNFDEGTRRAILRLYRSSPPEVLASAGRDLGAIGAPALVVWGARDPYLPPSFAEEYARVLSGELLVLADAGHWPWLDRPDAIDAILAFLAA